MARKKVAILIDFANLNSAWDVVKHGSKLDPGTRIDYAKLVSALTLGSEIVTKSIYMSESGSPNFRRFLDFFKHAGFATITKDVKVIAAGESDLRYKANMDVEIAVDACRLMWRRDCDEVVLISGDSDFAYLIDEAKRLSFQITIVSSVGSLSRELRERADRLVLIDDLVNQIILQP